MWVSALPLDKQWSRYRLVPRRRAPAVRIAQAVGAAAVTRYSACLDGGHGGKGPAWQLATARLVAVQPSPAV